MKLFLKQTNKSMTTNVKRTYHFLAFAILSELVLHYHNHFRITYMTVMKLCGLLNTYLGQRTYINADIQRSVFCKSLLRFFTLLAFFIFLLRCSLSKIGDIRLSHPLTSFLSQTPLRSIYFPAIYYLRPLH